MFKPSFVFVAALAAVCTPSFRAQDPQPAPSPNLPPGAMQAKAHTACMSCHDARIILQQRLSKAAWTKEVDKMIKWGTVLDSGNRDALIDYLSTNFPPEKPAEPSLRVVKAKRIAKAK